jgi:hypothetical protein
MSPFLSVKHLISWLNRGFYSGVDDIIHRYPLHDTIPCNNFPQQTNAPRRQQSMAEWML